MFSLAVLPLAIRLRDYHFEVRFRHEDGFHDPNRWHERVLRRRLGLETPHQHMAHTNTYVAMYG